MSLPIINFDPLLQTPSVRGIGWSLKKTENWKTVRQEAFNGRVVKIPRFNNPLEEWELKWNYVNDGWPGAIQPTQLSNAPYTDFQVLRSLYFQAKASGNEFLYQPQDSVVANQILPQADANFYSEVVHTVGGYPVAFGSTALHVSNVAITGNVLTVTCSTIDALSPGMTVAFSALTTATFLNGQTVTVSTVNVGANTFTAFFVHANYTSAADSGTATVTSTMQAVYESVQSLAGNALTSLSVNGTAFLPTTNYWLEGPSSVPPYDGYAVLWEDSTSTPDPPAAGSQILASYTYYYQCEFMDDSLEYENFLPYLWKVGSLKFKQVRL